LSGAGGHDLAKQAHHFAVAQWPLVTLHDRPENLRLALGPIQIRGMKGFPLALPNLERQAGALADQRLDLLIQSVDVVPHGRQVRLVVVLFPQNR